MLAGCATAPPKQQDNLCEIFREKSGWYEDAKDMEEEWGTPINVAMAIIKQESSFRHDARPPKDYVLGFIPWGRVSSAYGYAQAQDLLGKIFKMRRVKVVHVLTSTTQ